MKLGQYSKFIVALVGAAIIGATAFFTSQGNEVPSWFNTLVAVLSALGVYQVRNEG